MDLLFWKNSIPNLKISYTQKLFFNEFIYKLDLLAYGGGSTKFSGDMADLIKRRLSTTRSINYAGSWWAANLDKQLSQADIPWLEFLRELRLNTDFRIRIEEPKISLYHNDLSRIEAFMESLPQRCREYVTNLTIPRDSHEQTVLQSGAKVLRKKPKFKFKIHLRDGMYDLNTRENVLNYLESLGSDVRIPTHCRHELTKDFSNIWDSYFYAQDKKIVTFLSLINPKIIRTIIEMAGPDEINTVITQGISNGQST